LGITSAVLPVLAYLVVTAPYRLRRIFIFLDPWEDPLNSGYQIVQSFLAIGSGGIKGRGLGQSVQKLYYLPESFTDFIFSIIGEETGFLGAAFILLLFSALIFLGFRISSRAHAKYARLIGLGVVFMISLQCVIHIGVVTGCLPPKGLPLPFISFGGSSLITNMTGAGLLANIARRRDLV
jgi:cell division protein FtsW